MIALKELRVRFPTWERFRVKYACVHPLCKCVITRPCPAELTADVEEETDD